MMKQVLKQSLLLALLSSTLALTGCERKEATLTEAFENSTRSGTVLNDDIEAPLNEKSQKYEKALEVSNRFLDLWQQENFQTIHDELIDPEVQNILTVEKLADIHQNVVEYFGPVKGYKPMQWAFEPKRKKKQYFLFSIKVVHHDKEPANYLFQFLLDGGFEKLIGVYVRKQASMRAPGQIHNQQF